MEIYLDRCVHLVCHQKLGLVSRYSFVQSCPQDLLQGQYVGLQFRVKLPQVFVYFLIYPRLGFKLLRVHGFGP